MLSSMTQRICGRRFSISTQRFCQLRKSDAHQKGGGISRYFSLWDLSLASRSLRVLYAARLADGMAASRASRGWLLEPPIAASVAKESRDIALRVSILA